MKLCDAFNRFWLDHNLPCTTEWRKYYELRVAIEDGDYKGAKTAIENGADVNYKASSPKNRPLALALTNGQPEIFQLLLDKGAILHSSLAYDRRNERGRIPEEEWMTFEVSYLYAAVEQKQEEIARIIADHPAVNPLVSGVLEDHLSERYSGSDLYPRYNPYPRRFVYPITPLELAREKGMDDLADDLVRKVAQWERNTALRRADSMEQEAKRLFEDAAALRDKAEKLRPLIEAPRKDTPPPPAP